MVPWFSGTNLISITNLGLNLNVAATDVILNKGTSTIHFSEVSKLWDYSMEIVETEIFHDSIFCFFETETFRDCKCSNIARPMISPDCNLGFFETDTFQDLATIVETETFWRLSPRGSLERVDKKWIFFSKNTWCLFPFNEGTLFL